MRLRFVDIRLALQSTIMLSSKTYLLLNVNKLYSKRTLFTLTNRLVTLTATQSTNEPNVTKNEYKIIGFRYFGDKKSKRTDPIKVSFVEDEPRLTHVERLKRIIQNYGATAVVLHIALSLTSLGFFYCLIYFGFDITSYVNLEKFGETAAKVMAGSGTFAVAYALHKMIMPIRVTATVFLTPVVVRQLRAIGIIKRPHKPL